MLSNEILSLIEEIEVAEAELFEEDEIISDVEDADVEEVTTDEVTEMYVIRAGKKVKLDPLQVKRLLLKRKLRADGKVKEGQKIVFKKGATTAIIKTMTGQEKQLAKKRAIKAQTGAAKSKRARSMKLAHQLSQ